MLVEDVAELSPRERFFYWIKERHEIHLRRQKGMNPPWTDDVILQSHFFTNPYRENDKTTIWFREHVRDPMQDDPRVLFATVCFRWFNYIPTGELLLEHDLYRNWDVEEAVRVLYQQRQRVGKVFTGAFVIANGAVSVPKIDLICRRYIQGFHNNLRYILRRAKTWQTLKQAHQLLTKYPGFGGSGFMAYEVVTDLRFTMFLRNAYDVLSWCNPGPGAKRGMNRLTGDPINNTPQDWDLKVNRLLMVARKHPWIRPLPPLEMREIEHSLCEFDKYERIRLGEGKSKRMYDATGERTVDPIFEELRSRPKKPKQLADDWF